MISDLPSKVIRRLIISMIEVEKRGKMFLSTAFDLKSLDYLIFFLNYLNLLQELYQINQIY